jgi:hypothetical protein
MTSHPVFSVSESLKKHLDEKQFVTDDDVKQAVTSWLQALDTDFFYNKYKPWFHDVTHA